MFDLHASTKAHHVCSAVTALDTFPTRVSRPVFLKGRDLLGTAKLFVQGLGHGLLLKVKKEIRLSALVGEQDGNQFKSYRRAKSPHMSYIRILFFLYFSITYFTFFEL